MIVALLFLLIFNEKGGFVVEASCEARYTVTLPREALRAYVDDIDLFARNMPGVVDIQHLGADTYIYRTYKDVPLGRPVEGTFHIGRITQNDSVTRYQSLDEDARDFMSCTVLVVPAGDSETSVEVSLRLRLTRDTASEIHWLAPILGADFINRQMSEDLDAMLQEFIVNSSEDLHRQFKRGLSERNQGQRMEVPTHEMEYK